DSGQKAAEMRKDAGEEFELVAMEPRCPTMHDDRVQTRVGEHDFQAGSRGRISLLNRVNLLGDEHEYCSLVSALLAGAG
ncbi:MAG TPA: hypothetical protein VFL82_14090, partial [Thermomicrobiales bacterium]|nr:hypothetical protein [Thermomicrobiales bacterium]